MDSNNNPKFYHLIEAEKRGEARVVSQVDYDEWRLKSGEDKPPVPMPMRLSKGKKFYDIVCFQDPFNFLISNRIHSLLIEHKVSGWTSFPVKIEGHNEQYWGIQIKGRAGVPNRPAVPDFVIGLDFDISTWDGSDVFLLEGTLFTLISERLCELLISNKTTNLAVEEISKMKWYSGRPG
jgi:hypothetical protein